MQLQDLRDQIDKIDDQLLSLLRERFQLSTKIGQLKAAQAAPIQDHERESQILAKAGDESEKEVLKTILAESRKRQK